MLGIIRTKNCDWSWFEVLFDLPSGVLEVMSLGYLSLEGYKIIRNYDSWKECLMFLVSDFVFVLSFSYLTATWEYWDARNH